MYLTRHTQGPGNVWVIGRGAVMQHGKRVSDVFAKDDEAAAIARQAGEAMPAPQTTMVFHFTARSGSSWLSSVLTRAGLGIGTELFNPNFMPRMAQNFGARTLGEYVSLGPRYQSRNGVCSFEITGHQLKVVFADPSDFHAAFPDAVSYWLIREDIVAQAISLQKMVETGLAHATTIDAEGRRQADERFAYDAQAIRKWVLHSLMAEQVSERFFADFGVTPIRMSYERNIALGEEGLVALFHAHLGMVVPPTPPKATEENRHEKLATDKNREFAERFRAENADFLAEIAEERTETLAKLDSLDATSEGDDRIVANVTANETEEGSDAPQPDAPPVQRPALSRRWPGESRQDNEVHQENQDNQIPLTIHIGAHKTGTTLLQKTFVEERSKLARHGVIYPNTNWFHFAQHRLAFALKGKRDPSQNDKPDLDAEMAQLSAALSQAQQDHPEGAQVFVSSEALFDLDRNRIEALYRHLPTRNVSILAVLRRPDNLMLSIYNQKMKGPLNKFARPIEDFWHRPERLAGDLAMARCVENWASVFGRERILLRRYEEANPLEIAFTALGLPPDFVTQPKRVNQGTPAAVAEIMRLAKQQGMEPGKRDRLLRRAVRRHKGGAPLEPGTEIRRSVLAAMQPDLDRLFAEFGMENPYLPEAVPDGIAPAPDLDPQRLLDELTGWVF
jgi:LPS sulfotransferase NodH